MPDFIAACEKELAGLIDPYMTDPEPLFAWEADEVNKEVRLLPRNNVPMAHVGNSAPWCASGRALRCRSWPFSPSNRAK